MLLLQTTMKLLLCALLLSLFMALTLAQNDASNLEPCKIVLFNNEDVFGFTETKLRINTKFEKDNRPCSLSIKKPNEEEASILTLTKDKVEYDHDENTSIEVKRAARKLMVKFMFNKTNEEITLRGKYQISNLTFFAFPAQAELDTLEVYDLSCPNVKLTGHVNLTEDFRMCCEYHRSKTTNMSEGIQCCENGCLDIQPKNLVAQIHYDERYLKFTIPATKEDQPSPLTIQCIIKGQATRPYEMGFKPSTKGCFFDYGKSSVGLGIGLCIVFLLCMVVIYYWWKTKKKVKDKDGKLKLLMKPPDLPEWADPFHYPRGYLNLEKEIGIGSFGVVIMAQAQNLGTSGNNVAGSNTVAVKTHRGGGGGDLDEFLKEGEIMSKLDFHYNVLNLLGVTQDTPDKGHRLLFILDYCSRGSLDKILTEKLVEIKKNPELVETEDFNMKLLVAWTYHIAMGMKFLSSKNIIHGDLAARNILVDGDNTAKIADFGKAHRLKYDNIGISVKGNQPMWWMAPEALEKQTVTMESDKWSYGVTVWEIFSLGEEPYADRMVFEGLLTDLFDGYRMPLPERCPKEIYKQVILTCWDVNAEKRPDWSELIDILNKMVDGKYLQRYDIIQTRKRNNYSEMRKFVTDNVNINPENCKVVYE